ncbi:hypothetical protein ACGFY3_42490 [Streptomyces mirabilis]|uniref:hypothetical protein n=1 Tax=Streptomyces mirabilis TaxID=68239 RepID=UPI00370FF3D4
MRLLATDAAHRAHALLNALTSPSGRTMDPGLMMPTNPKADAARLAATTTCISRCSGDFSRLWG